jgi:hypothetical protein
MKRTNRLLLLLALLAPSPCPAAEAREPVSLPGRVRIAVDAGFWPTKPSFGDTRQYAEYAETSTVRTTYAVSGAGFGPDLSAQLRLYRGLGVLVGYSRTSRDESGHFDAQRPHPLYLARPRSLSGELGGYRYQEGALHVDLALASTRGRVDWGLFAGVTRFQVEADLLDRLAYDEAYPYDDLSLASAPARRVKESPTGFNVGGRLDYRFGRNLGAGVQLRYSRASVKLRATSDATEAGFNAGGLQAGAGLRLYF